VGHLSCGVNIYVVCINVIFKFAIFSSCICSTILFFYISNIWASKEEFLCLCLSLVNPFEIIVFYNKYFKFIDFLGFVSKATL
jgi:hypothetical protein